MGSAALAHLASRGVPVLGIEAHAIGHALGSSHGHSRVIRKVYFEDPRYVPLLRRSYELWRLLEVQTGETLVVETGCLTFGPRDHSSIQTAITAAKTHGLPHEVLDAAEIAERWPAFRPGEQDLGILDPEGGIAAPERCVLAHAAAARARGATIHEGERVLSVKTDRHGVRIETDRDRYSAEMVVITQGPWLTQGLVSCPVPLRVERQVQLWFEPRRPEIFAIGRFPVFIHFTHDRAFYGMPPFGLPAVKVCRHHGGAAADPDTLDRTVHDGDVEQVRAHLRAHLPDADGPLLHGEVCMYTNTPDDNFVIGIHPSDPRIVLAGGFSGHGFKLAPVVGEILADLTTRARTDHEIAFFDPARPW
jgi:sarcosine oxidase